ncbi:MAG TPA: hypothetical protein PKW94_01095 [Candidatus Dojkabacteria bacterium]|nr:hypothetical protein [Candidatus Dojkabacteria bacterium]HOT60885.1 hypothetical protein [Candidatus Dojkabacteria bacterium]
MFVSRESKDEQIEWALEILTLEIPFCPEIMEEQVKKAIEILLTYLPDPQIGIKYKEQIFLKEKYKTLCPSPVEALALIQNQ